MEEIILNVGQKYKLKGNTFIGKFIVTYTGMPNEQTISIAEVYTDGNSGFSYNLYYPLNQKKIEIDHATIEILHVDKDSLRCLITKK